MQFQIPQFIDIEDKIAGPLTLKQLLYLVVGGIIVISSFFLLPVLPALFIALVAISVSLSFAFIKYNGQPLAQVTMSALQFYFRPHLYLWKREEPKKIVQLPDLPVIKKTEDELLNERKNLKEFSFGSPTVKKLWTDLSTSKNPIPKREKVMPTQEKKEMFNIFRKASGEKMAAKRIDYR